MSKPIWTIRLYQINGPVHKFRVAITGDDPLLGLYGLNRAKADGRTPHEAYERACAMLVVKPWLESTP